MTIDSAASISAASSTKTITEVLLLQTVTDPTGAVLLYSTQAPFTISFVPTRLGTASFAAIAVFSDNTYAMTTLNYSWQGSDVHRPQQLPECIQRESSALGKNDPVALD